MELVIAAGNVNNALCELTWVETLPLLTGPFVGERVLNACEDKLDLALSSPLICDCACNGVRPVVRVRKSARGIGGV